MATKDEKELLIETLKFTPRTYHISLWGYGGERVMGRVSQEEWDYCMENQVDLSDVAWNSDAAEDMGLDADKLPFPPGSWYECDGFAHTNGVSRDAGTLQIEDENGETVIECELESFDGGDDSPELETIDEVYLGQFKKDDIIFIGSSNEKGTFFEADLELTAPFDITKLTLLIEEVDGEEIVSGVTYNGEEIDNYGGSTDGKSSDFTMVRMKDDAGNFERYEPEEKDWGHPEFGTSPDEWEKTVDFNFKKTKPTIPGYYNAVWSNWGTSYGSLYWNGTEFGEWEHGKFNPQPNVEKWSGYNWDTSDWSNRPPAPPELICDNKKCGWVGNGEDRREDEDYNDHCPDCDGTEFSWIDYDPNTKKGLKNREKYCHDLNNMTSVPKDDPVYADFNALMDADIVQQLDAIIERKEKEKAEGKYDYKGEFDVDAGCVQCDWTGTVDDLYYEDDFADGVCPECHEAVEFLTKG